MVHFMRRSSNDSMLVREQNLQSQLGGCETGVDLGLPVWTLEKGAPHV